MTGWTEGKIGANGINVHYHRTGGATASGTKPAMLLLHGITDNGLCWTRVAAALEDRYDIVMTDARGHGKSDGLATGFSVPILADDAAGVIRGLGLERPVVFGHSMGAITAAALAANYPDLVGAVILEDPPLRNATAPLPAEFIAKQRAASGPAQNPHWHPLETTTWADAKAEVDPTVFEQVGSLDRYPWRDAFARIQCPGLLLTGNPAKMAIVTRETAAEAVVLWQAGEVAHIAGAGHCIHRDKFDEALAAVSAFLERQSAA